MDTILLQKQVRDNSEDLQSFMRDLVNWEDEMKRKENEIRFNANESTIPPIRSKKNKNTESSDVPETSQTKRISSYDYASWDKFDVDQACADADVQDRHTSSSSSDDEPLPKLTDEQLKQKAYFEKDKGNRFVKEQKWTDAVICYTEAIKFYSYDPIFYANRALCYLKLKKYQYVDTDCTTSLQLDSTYVKAYQRRAAARFALNQYQSAYSDLQEVLKLEPHNSESKRELQKVLTQLNKNKCLPASKPFTPKFVPSTSKEQKGKGDSSETTKKIISNVNEISQIYKKKDEINPSIQFQSENEDVVLIQPIHKAPHLRSKKPLKRIEIVEKNYETSLKSTVFEIPEISHKKEVFVDYPVPSNCLQFSAHWKTMQNDSSRKYSYIMKIPPDNLPNIFQEFLESDLFSEIINTIAECFVPADWKKVLTYLLALTNVKRFSTIIMFMSNNDRKALRTIVNKVSSTCEANEIDILLEKYELVKS